MKRLFLLRHAKTHPAEPGEEDHDRTLMPRGRDDAARMARHLRAHGLAPERVLVSSAVRTLQTAELALAVRDEGALDVEDVLRRRVPLQLLARADGPWRTPAEALIADELARCRR